MYMSDVEQMELAVEVAIYELMANWQEEIGKVHAAIVEQSTMVVESVAS